MKFEKTSHHYADKKGRSQGRSKTGYGADYDGKVLDVDIDAGLKKSILEFSSNVEFGKYKLGFDFEIGHTGFNVGAFGGEKPQKIVVGKKFSELLSGEDKDLIDPKTYQQLRDGIKKAIKCDIENVVVKEIIRHGKKVGASAGIGLSSTGAAVRAQLDSIEVLLDTGSYGEIGVEVGRGFGAGLKVAPTTAKNGKKGHTRSSEIRVGNMGISFNMPDLVKGLEKDFAGSSSPAAVKEAVSKGQAVVDKVQQTMLEQPSAGGAVGADVVLTAVVDELGVHVKGAGMAVTHYHEAADKPAAFAKMLQELNSLKVEELATAGVNVAFMLSSVAQLTKSKDLAKFSVGLSSTMNTFTGIADIAMSASAISTAGFSVAAVGSLAGGLGAVLGAVSLLSSAFGGDDDDSGLADALNAIHSAVMGMWQDMHESFAVTWKMLEHIDERLIQMEQNNIERCKLLLEGIEQTHQAVVLAHRELQQQVERGFSTARISGETFQRIATEMSNHIVDQDMQQTVGSLAKLSHEERRSSLAKDSTTLYLWLTSTSLLNARTGELDLYYPIDRPELSKKLLDTINPSNTQDDFPLGLFHSLFLEATSTSKPPEVHLVNPKGWFSVLTVYLSLICEFHSHILNSYQPQYHAEFDSIHKLINQVSGFYEDVAASSELWTSLVGNYQNTFVQLNNYLDATETKEVNQRLQGNYRLSLRESVEANVQRLQSREDSSAVIKEWGNLYPVKWVDSKAKQQNDLSVGTDLASPKGYNHGVPAELPEVVFSPKMNDAVFGHEVIQTARDGTLTTAGVALAIALDVAKPSVAYYCYNVADVTKIPHYAWFNHPKHPYVGQYFFEFTCTFMPGLSVGEAVLPFGQVNLYRTIYLYRCHGREEHLWQTHSNPPVRHCYDQVPKMFTSKEDIEDHKLWTLPPGIGFGEVKNYDMNGLIHPTIAASRKVDIAVVFNGIEAQILQPARVDASKRVLKNFNLRKEELLTDYLQLVTFVKLIDPTFAPPKEPEVFVAIEKSLNALEISGSSADLKELGYLITSASAWNTEILNMYKTQMKYGDILTANYLQEKMTALLTVNPIVKKAKIHAAEVLNLMTTLTPLNAARIAKQNLDNLKLTVCEHSAMLVSSVDEVVGILEQVTKLSVNSSLTQPLVDSVTVMVDQVRQDLPLTSCGISPPASPNPFDSDPPADATAAPNVPPVLESKGTKLQQLLTRIPIVYEDVKSHINSYKNYSKLVAEVNSADKRAEIRPLHLALASGRADLVELLLKNDASVDNDSSRFIYDGRTEEETVRIRALLHFHAYLQRGATGQDAYVGKALGLINQCGDSLRHHVAVQNAVVVISETRKGKSSMINCVHCTDYLKEKVGTDYRLTPDPKQVPACEQPATTSNSRRSETICPQIVFAGQHNSLALVDTPGTWESRPLPWKIAGGVSMQLLAQHIQTMKAIVVVFTVRDLNIESAGKIKETLAIAAAAVHGDVSLLKHVVFVANQASNVTPKDVAEQFELMLTDFKEQHECSPEMDFLLSHVKQIKIIVVDTPAAEFRTEVLSHLDTLNSTEFSRFHFAAYHSEAVKFSAMTKSVVDYHQAEQKEWRELQKFAKKELHNQVKAKLDYVRSQPEADLEAVAGMILDVPAETKDAFTKQKTYFEATDKIRKLLISGLGLIYDFTAAADKNPDTHSSSIPLGNVMSLMTEKQCRLSISSSFINVVLPYLQQEKLFDMKLDEDVIRQFDYQTCSGSAWPFPGACAGFQQTSASASADWAFHMYVLTSGVIGLKDGITWSAELIFDFSRQLSQSLLSKAREMSSVRHLASLLKLRVTPLNSMSSSDASGCLRQWSGVWKYILPVFVEPADATVVSVLVPMCRPEQHTVRVWITYYSSVTVWTTAEGSRSVTVHISDVDAAIVSRSMIVLPNSFVTGFVVQLTRVLSVDCSDFIAHLCVLVATMAIVALLSGPAVSLIVLAQWVVSHCLLSSHIGQLLAPYAYVMIVAMQVVMELKHMSLLFVILRFVLSIMGSKLGISLGNQVGQQLRCVAARLWQHHK